MGCCRRRLLPYFFTTHDSRLTTQDPAHEHRFRTTLAFGSAAGLSGGGLPVVANVADVYAAFAAQGFACHPDSGGVAVVSDHCQSDGAAASGPTGSGAAAGPLRQH